VPHTHRHNHLPLRTTRQQSRWPRRLSVPSPSRSLDQQKCFHLHSLRRRFSRTKSRHSRTVSEYAGGPINTQWLLINVYIERSGQHGTDLQISPSNQTSVSARHTAWTTIQPHIPTISGIHHYAPGPPRSLTASLGREIEKFDQLCDALESRLVRVFPILHPTRILTR
jgi:hypothetical protein